MRKFLLSAALLIAAIAPAWADGDGWWYTPGGKVVNGGVGMYVNAAGQAVPYTQNDPCQNLSNTKISVPVNITTVTTTQLVPLSGTTSIYICGGTLTISPSATTADSATLEYGTGTNCGTGTTALTGAFGAGDLTTTAPPIVVSLDSSGVVAAAPAGKALCLLSAGGTVNIQGIISYIQQ